MKTPALPKPTTSEYLISFEYEFDDMIYRHSTKFKSSAKVNPFDACMQFADPNKITDTTQFYITLFQKLS